MYQPQPDTAAHRKPLKSNPSIVKLYNYRYHPTASIHVTREYYERIVKILGNKAIRLLVGYYNEQYKLNIKHRANYSTASKFVRAMLEESVIETLKMRETDVTASLPLVIELVTQAEMLDKRKHRQSS